MQTVVDSLVVTLDLEASSLKKGLEEVDRGLKQIGKATEKTSREFSDMGRQFDNALRKMRNEFLGFMSVFTAGKSIKNFVEDTIQSSAELDRLSKNLGIAATRLRAYQDANKRAGGSEEGILGQIKRNADDIARYNSGMGISEAIKWSLSYGVPVTALKDAETYLKAQSDVIARINRIDPNRARVYAQQMGLDENVFNLIKDGASALDGYLKNAAKLSGMTNKDAAAAEKLRQEFNDLEDEFRKTGERIVFALNPAFREIIAICKQMAQWVNENQGDIVQFITDATEQFKTFVNAVKSGKYDEQIADIKRVGEAFVAVGLTISSVVGFLKEWKALTSGAGYELKRWDLTEGNENALFRDNIGRKDLDDPKNVKARKEYLYYRLKEEGFTDNQVFGIIGSLLGENDTLDPARRGLGGAYGIAQWEDPRQKEFEKYFGRSIIGSAFVEQVAFKIHELRTTEKRAADLIRQQTTVDGSAVTHSDEYERPNPKKARNNVRIDYARQVAREFGKELYNPISGISPTALTAQNTTTINNYSPHLGPITIRTGSADPKAIVKELKNSFPNYSISNQANRGIR
ncbi:phage tail tip lysozyme [Oxalobacter paraformigenes]|uniref:Phage tail lysozyme domain-containing protein n=1 Tax=Oxalobacter paraformigenes TaxID=556268 RepID=C3X4R3_9BURK|nr:phage tail tip lysozyme [Oxalobacter paraformigenes]EEO28199.1 hypothetical protein OFAG_01352 [Oxalobacter paraformigenes]